MEQTLKKLEDMKPNERIKYIREKIIKLSRPEIFRKYGLSVDTLAAWENGKLKLSENAIKKYINVFAAENVLVSREWILEGVGLEPSFSLDLSKYFKTKDNEDAVEIDDNFLLIKEIEFFKELTPNSITCLITTDDMLPLYAKGDYVGGRLRFGKDIDDFIGKDCIVNTLDDAIYVRRVAKNINNEAYNLFSLNPSCEGLLEPVIFNVKIKSLAPIVWHRRLEA